MKKTLITLFFGLLVLAPACACTCECKNREVNDPKEMLRKAKSVFVGEVIEWHEANKEEMHRYSNPIVVRVRVEQYWKGVKTQEILISSMGMLRHGCCDIALEEGQKYLVYAAGRNLHTGCTRTMTLKGAESDLAALGPGKTFSK
jgi:hypothetical protein